MWVLLLFFIFIMSVNSVLVGIIVVLYYVNNFCKIAYLTLYYYYYYYNIINFQIYY